MQVVYLTVSVERSSMKIRELAEKCEARSIKCEGCPYEEACENLTEKLKTISPIGLVDMVEENHIIY